MPAAPWHPAPMPHPAAGQPHARVLARALARTLGFLQAAILGSRNSPSDGRGVFSPPSLHISFFFFAFLFPPTFESRRVPKRAGGARAVGASRAQARQGRGRAAAGDPPRARGHRAAGHGPSSPLKTTNLAVALEVVSDGAWPRHGAVSRGYSPEAGPAPRAPPAIASGLPGPPLAPAWHPAATLGGARPLKKPPGPRPHPAASEVASTALGSAHAASHHCSP